MIVERLKAYHPNLIDKEVVHDVCMDTEIPKRPVVNETRVSMLIITGAKDLGILEALTVQSPGTSIYRACLPSYPHNSALSTTGVQR